VTDGPATDPVPDRPRRGRAGLRRVGRILRRTGYVVVALAVLLVSGLLPVQTIRIPSDSMTPTISPGDHLLLEKLHPAEVLPSSVVVLHDPLGDDLIVKRVVAVGGDSIGFDDGILMRNDRPVVEPYTIDFLDGVYYGPYVVPAGMIYLLGDNRADSVDSRTFGPVPVSSVVGRVVARVFPSPGPL
jgi:signal peptidase I